MIVAYAGVQVDDAATAQRRLPVNAVPDVEARVRRLLARLQPRLVLGAAASGADLIVARAARLENVPVRLVLPHDRDTFRRTSVSSRGADWVERYDRLLDDVDVETGNADPDMDGVYEAHNRRLLDRASELSERDEKVWAFVIAPANIDPASVTADFAERAAARQLLVLDIDPLKTRQQRRRVFVAMPYGKKFDPDTRRNLDCDTVFDKVYVPALEDQDLEWERADLQTDSGIIHAGMIDALANADLVLADMSTGNANVAYELGLRHAFAAYATVVTKPVVQGARRTQVPFDVAMIRHVHISRTFNELSDHDAQEGIRKLRQTLTHVLSADTTDSPVFAWFERDETSRRLVQHHEQTAELDGEVRLRRVVQTAVRSSAKESIQDALREVDSSDVRDDVLAGLRLELAVAAAHEKDYETAVAAFDRSEPPEDSPLRATWLEQYGVTLSWRGRDAAKVGEDPTPHWQRAEQLLNEAREEFGDSEETCGILGGLVKGRCHWHLERGQTVQAGAALRRMTALYQAGFDAEPSYYAGVNLVAGLRLSMLRLQAAEWTAEHVSDTITVVRFFAERACKVDPDGFWPLVTLAELDLHAHLLTGGPGPDAAAARYAEAAAVPAPKAWRQSAAYQLDLLMRFGDPADVIQPLVDLLATDSA